MTRGFFLICSLLVSALGWAQTDTEVYLFDLKVNNAKPTLSNPKNISNNPGYDNQPSFWDDDSVLFASTRQDQTDVLQFNVNEGSTSSWLTYTTTGSEYSPLRIPGKNAISAIRLDLDGLQRLYEYDFETSESTPITDLKIGYHVWFNDHILVATVLMENRMDLKVMDLEKGTQQTVHQNVGRSLHKIPGTDLISFISKRNNTWEIMSLGPITGESKKITKTYAQEEDICWLDENTIITGAGKRLLTKKLSSDADWETIIEFPQEEINNISRIAISPNSKRLAFVAEESPAKIIQKQVKAFNSRDLDGFVACFADNVLVQRFPNEKMYQGISTMRDNYERFFENVKSSSVEVVNRIILGNTIIDEEKTKVDGRDGHQVAIYQVENGLIASMTFVFPDGPLTDAESVVQEQLEAYNNRDIEAFTDTYANGIELYDFPKSLNLKGKSKLAQRYGSFFEDTPDLHCEIQNRIVIGNKVIDHESVTVNGMPINAIGIYEVDNGEIAKVTFIK
ncbi:nuclear transport factor 2 family protein [Flagellimonas halotolerans]|uniref:Nuclear transport factor 2 family protein n=1 Tax=Flagellimonas halotolerans TaxID=3112164 RepID=A0ABU6IUK2_9FLAO|nr:MULTISPECIES: nuclear transport factor 2 family protein [unclassified Allomuricauda]MEC3966723.1 nuclear transport factor 2 family protein [Muricauda sp. SYSU M86414]MEC4266628.1 nuclear transport factor 2 family protein [Muricauda sp. SYSU M84420]